MPFRPAHIIALIVILVIIFGYKKLPDIARSFGKSAKVLKQEIKELNEDEPKVTTNQASNVSANSPTYQVTNQGTPPQTTLNQPSNIAGQNLTSGDYVSRIPGQNISPVQNQDPNADQNPPASNA